MFVVDVLNVYIMTYIGIDVSKDTLEVAFPSKDGYRNQTFGNTPKGIHSLIQKLSREEHHCVMEATGNYSALLIYMLSRAGIMTSMENPLKVKNFSRVMLSMTKTDKADARLLALYGEKMNPALYRLKSDSLLILRQKRTVIRQLQKQLTASRNLLHSLEVLPIVDSASKSAILKVIKSLEKQVGKLEGELTHLTKSEYDRQMKALTSIKGIGASLAAALIISTGGFTYFDNAKQISRFLGLCPTYQQSGTSVNVKGHINRNGDSCLRAQLYVASWSASQHNAACRECYLRLRERGKPGKVAMIAVANKLIRQAFAVVTQNQLYIDGFESTLIHKS